MSGVVERFAFPASLVITGIVLAVAAEHVALLKAFVDFVDGHRQSLLAVTLGAVFLGFLLFMGGVLHLLMTSSEPMTHAEVEAHQGRIRDLGAQPYVARRSVYRFFGKTAGRQANAQVTFAELKAAWAGRRWRHDVRWRCIFAIIAGAFLSVIGGFSAAAVAAPSFIRFMLLAALGYAAVRTAWGLWRA